MLLIAVHSNMCGIFQQQFSKYKVTMTTLCDEIEAGIATSFNCFIQCDFQGNQADFHDINNYSKGSEGNSFQYICLIQKLYCSEHLQASYQAEIRHKGFACSGPFLTYSSCLIKNLQLDIYILLSFTIAVTI